MAAKAAKAIVDLGKQSLELYAQYEQLTGGIETLFKDSQDIVMGYAENAYKTAGMSANQYMETVTSFSASLISSMGGDTKAAAEKANLAITDMSDNANKMGSSMESLQNAYQGFAKQNYTMLDNLNLGYGGSKEGMERLLADAEKLSGIKFDINNYADIVQAIHIVQTEMGITGTTAEEASTTIEGSINSMKASWENLLTGMANGEADMGELLDNFLESVKTVAKNVLPVIKTIVPNLITGLVEIIIELASAIIDNMDKILDAGVEIIVNLAKGIEKQLPKLMEKMPQMIVKLAAAIIKALPKIVAAAVEIVKALIKGIISYQSSAIATIGNLVQKLITKIKGYVSKFKSAGKSIFTGLWDGIKGVWSSISNWVSSKVSWLADKLAFWKKSNSEMKKDGSHRTGLKEVPYDGYMAELHRGEMVLTAAEAKRYQKNLSSAETNSNKYEINFNGSYSFRDKDDINHFMNKAQRLIDRRLTTC